MSEQERQDTINDCDGPIEIVQSDQTGPAPAWIVDHDYSLEATIGHDADEYFITNLTLGQAYERLGELIQVAEAEDGGPFDIRLTERGAGLVHHVWTADGKVHYWTPLRQGNAPMPTRGAS